MYERILLPTDGSPVTTRVVDHALHVAELSGATLHTLSVVDESIADLDLSSEERDQIIASLEREGREATESIEARAADAGVDVVTAVREGTPYRSIVDYAIDEGIDLIVMGTHGRSGLDRFLLGSVTERVIRSTDVPVLTVHLPESGLVVTEERKAVELATKALEDDGYHVDDVVEEPYREASTWVVRVLTRSGTRFNVHIDASTEEVRYARTR